MFIQIVTAQWDELHSFVLHILYILTIFLSYLRTPSRLLRVVIIVWTKVGVEVERPLASIRITAL